MSENPYKALPDYHFWRRSISSIEPFLIDPVIETRFQISEKDKVATAGSCFAQHISNRLQKSGYNYFVPENGDGMSEVEKEKFGFGIFSARFGNIYTTRQLLQLFYECQGMRNNAEPVWFNGEGYVDSLRPQVEPKAFENAESVLRARSVHLKYVREMFLNCDVFVFTLGLTETWRSKVDGTVYPLVPGVVAGDFDPEKYEFVNFDVQDVISDTVEFLEQLKKVNPKVRVVLTVSPVPLIATYAKRHVLVSTTYSKSVLRVCAEHAYQKFSWVDYFPSYEIITGNFSGGKYYEEDLRGVNSIGVDHAMRCFLQNYTEISNVSTQSNPIDWGGTDNDVVCDEEAIDAIKI